jgi:ABC-type sulfate/molybdate transport systems ATPase subunit
MRARPPHSRGIGMVFQRSALWPHMTVAQNILFGVTGISREQAALQLRTLLVQAALEGLAERFPAQLSGGEARRVALARALAAAPQRLLFDEPLTSQDPELKGRLLETIRGRVRESGATLVYVTHDAAEARQVGGRIVRMNRGRLEAD